MTQSAQPVKVTLPSSNNLSLKSYVFEAKREGESKLIFKQLKNLCRHYDLSYHAVYFNLRNSMKFERDGISIQLRLSEPAEVRQEGDYEIVKRLKLADA